MAQWKVARASQLALHGGFRKRDACATLRRGRGTTCRWLGRRAGGRHQTAKACGGLLPCRADAAEDGEPDRSLV